MTWEQTNLNPNFKAMSLDNEMISQIYYSCYY